LERTLPDFRKNASRLWEINSPPLKGRGRGGECNLMGGKFVQLCGIMAFSEETL